ncbi:MAG: hypothetical protein ACSLEW_05525 [Nocardioides sp.]
MSAPGRRRAEAPPRVVVPVVSADRRMTKAQVVLSFTVVLAGLGLLGARILDLGPEMLGPSGSLLIAAVYTWAVVARSGGRPVIFTALVLVLGGVSVVSGDDYLRSSSAVATGTLAAVLGVMMTVPAVRFAQALREATVAVAVASVGAVAVLGFEPSITLAAFDYAVLVLSLVATFGLVFRLGAGFHGLGRRGVLIVLIGAVVLTLTLMYAELLRRYGTAGLIEDLLDMVRWSRDTLGAFPRPLETVLGVPALVWGTHMRARRRQGWWVCAFGAAATAPVATCLLNPEIGALEAALSVLYGLIVGALIGAVVIRIDLFLTGSPATGTRRRPSGRRAAIDMAEDEGAIRPEPARVDALL